VNVRASGDGTVDYQEFCNLMKEMVAKAAVMEKQIREAFGAIDTNGDGQISSSEIVKAMAAQGRKLSTEEADEIIGSIDKDGDKTISYDGRWRIGCDGQHIRLASRTPGFNITSGQAWHIWCKHLAVVYPS